ncbi:MAG: hypothetical protein WB473_06285, partial [Pedococcus sp.]
MSNSTTLLPFQPSSMTPAQLAAVSFLARYTGPTHTLYAAQLRRWFGWCEANELDPWTGSSAPTLSSTSASWARQVSW